MTKKVLVLWSEHTHHIVSNWYHFIDVIDVPIQIVDDPEWKNFPKIVMGLKRHAFWHNYPSLCQASCYGVIAFGLGRSKKLREMTAKLSLAVSLQLHGYIPAIGDDEFGRLCSQARENWRK